MALPHYQFTETTVATVLTVNGAGIQGDRTEYPIIFLIRLWKIVHYVGVAYINHTDTSNNIPQHNTLKMKKC